MRKQSDTYARAAKPITTVLLADANQLLTTTLAAFLHAEGFGDVIICPDFGTARKRIKSGPMPDLAMIDFDLLAPGDIPDLLSSQPHPKLALLTSNVSGPLLRSSIDAGVDGIFPKSMVAKSIAAGIRFIEAGELFLPYDLMQTLSAGHPFAMQTNEVDILHCLARGLSNNEISAKLGISSASVKQNVKKLCRKLDAKNRTHAAIVARDAGVI